jgi:CRISPR/Cas system-associated endoribonuclease Cas2
LGGTGIVMTRKKRKAEAVHLEETDRVLYSVFHGTANSLSQLYTIAMGVQKASFQASERHAMVRTPIHP